jgi:RsiW-degrading membrane proteinase PrsW (M82 family)
MKINHKSMNPKTQAATGIFSIILSFLATSHHWLHMGILTVLGGSTNMMAAMSAVVWIRRTMIVITIIMILLSIYRLNRHRSKPIWILIFSIVSVMLSLGFITFTLIQYGW